METKQLTALLANLTGHLRVTNADEKKRIEKLQKTIAEAALYQDPSTIRGHEFIYERSDMFLSSKIGSSRLDKIGSITGQIIKGDKPPQTKVFVRNVPVRTTQIPGSITHASAGVHVETLGPFTDSYGVSHWFDFAPITRLIALYIKGQRMPVILFKAKFREPLHHLVNGIPVELVKNFAIEPNTLWIHGKVFSPEVPENCYCGLRVKGGTLSADTLPFLENNKLTLPANAQITCELKLEQSPGLAGNLRSAYGKDARNASLQLPDVFKFSCKNQKISILAISDAEWKVYGEKNKFSYVQGHDCMYHSGIGRVGIPMNSEPSAFRVRKCESEFFSLAGKAEIKNSWWALSVTTIDISHPLEAAGNGALLAELSKGLFAKWTGLQNKSVALKNPVLLGEPDRIGITDQYSDGSGAFQQFDGWKDDQNIHGTALESCYLKDTPFIYNTIAAGVELISGKSDWDIRTDRPVKVNGEAVAVRTKGSVFIIAISDEKALLMVIDENMLWDNKLPGEKIPKISPFALALHNALFTVTPPNGLVLFAESGHDLKTLTGGSLILAFGLYSYLPTLPDPYAANLGIFNNQFATVNVKTSNVKKAGNVWLWLIGLVKWQSNDQGDFTVNTSFHFAPLAVTGHIQAGEEMADSATKPGMVGHLVAKSGRIHPQAYVQTGMVIRPETDDFTGNNLEGFSLLDVSSKANQMGISFGWHNGKLHALAERKFKINVTDEYNAVALPFWVTGLDVITAGMNAQAFTVPAIAWEPVFNLTPPAPPFVEGTLDADGILLTDPGINDPPVGFNYYKNDGIPTRIGNFSLRPVPLSPIPMMDYLVDSYRNKEDGITFAVFNLPFGMLAMAILDHESGQMKIPDIKNIRPEFDNSISGGIQLELTAGTSFLPDDENNMFEGFTMQLVNINDPDGTPNNSSTLAGTPTQIFNNEFHINKSNLPGRPGVPVTGIGISGYGASMFSEWQNKAAIFAQTSQAQFNVVTGRTNHEVVQVKSMLYPWGIRVVRTITLFRLANGYVARIDSGWKAESDGKYDFDYHKVVVDSEHMPVMEDGRVKKELKEKPFIFHPGIVRGLFNVRNIREQPKVFRNGEADLRAVTFDADVMLEHVTEGAQGNLVPSKGILAYVQVAPAARPITPEEFTALLRSENNSIGGPVGCVLKVAGTPQRMKISRFDVAAADDQGDNPRFVCAARGSVIMPKDGSWTMVQHARRTGDVSPLPEQLGVPLVRIGQWVKDQVVPDNANDYLLRLANPEDLLKAPDENTINFGLLQNMGTQKVLFMAPGFKTGINTLLSKTPPLFADSFRLLNSNGIFPNIGTLDNDFGQAISLLKGLDVHNNPVAEAFESIIAGANDKVYKLLELHALEPAGKLLDQGYSLAKKAGGVIDKALKFDLPSFDYPLINLPGKLVIAIQYKADSTANGGGAYTGKLDYDVNSFANKLADTWKGRMDNLSIVVSIGPLTEVMTIKGNFNSQKGVETDFGSSNDPAGLSLPKPEIKFSEALDPVIEVLAILDSLSTGEYGDALKKGLKIAMSNSANIWEYKFEANKDIPLVKFPPTKALYDNPSTPLKLEASMSLGVFFNSALRVTSDPSQLLPSAGGYFKFHGGLQVMCATVGGASLYAVGQVDLKLEADTSPRVAVTMKFGFGVQIAVGIPVVGNASVLFMVGLEVFADSSAVVKITAIMLFRGHAELLGGLVGVTITIEARGTVEQAGNALPGEGTPPTSCKAQVTFALDISIFLIIDISFSETWEETRRIA
ncbi:MAG: hypothetical protein JXB49_25155 [Bacteroidales bacterium]|nr:hypothetical protein [Bacteroidales bacterium]